LSIDYSSERAVENSNFVSGCLEKARFIADNEKSQWEPVTEIQWLGIQVNFKNKTYSVSEKRIKSLLTSLENIFRHSARVTAKELYLV